MATIDLVNAILNDENSDALQHFHTELASKINTVLDARKEELATDWLDNSAVTGAEDSKVAEE
ncbi:hypothetical protein CL614_10700 [archaeon]|nr:hypothetical protein [archaeon]MAH44164.1 hypothetical protein [archaeon]|tara:strand:+ start:2312 stop:2500 length:189 start_codon:yes stop_codon:yes gene_type:complete